MEVKESELSKLHAELNDLSKLAKHEVGLTQLSPTTRVTSRIHALM